MSPSPLEKAEARKTQEGQVSYGPRSFTHKEWSASPVTQRPRAGPEMQTRKPPRAFHAGVCVWGGSQLA